MVTPERECHWEEEGWTEDSVWKRRRRKRRRRGRRRRVCLYLSLSDEKHLHCRPLGVEGLYFHWLTEHRHGEDQAQDLHGHKKTETKTQMSLCDVTVKWKGTLLWNIHSLTGFYPNLIRFLSLKTIWRAASFSELCRRFHTDEWRDNFFLTVVFLLWSDMRYVKVCVH